FTADEDQQRARLAVLGVTVVRELFGDANPIGEDVKINKGNFQGIGVLPGEGATGFWDEDGGIGGPPHTPVQRLFGKDYVDSVDIEVGSVDEMTSIQNQVQALMMKIHHIPAVQSDAFQVRNMADIQSALSATSETMSWLLASIATISLLVGGIGIMNIMLV